MIGSIGVSRFLTGKYNTNTFVLSVAVLATDPLKQLVPRLPLAILGALLRGRHQIRLGTLHKKQ